MDFTGWGPPIIDYPSLCVWSREKLSLKLLALGITPKPRCWTLTCFPWQPEQHLQGGGTSWDLLNPKTSGCQQTSCSWDSPQGVQDQAGHTTALLQVSTSRSSMDHSQACWCCYSLRWIFPAPHFWPMSQKSPHPAVLSHNPLLPSANPAHPLRAHLIPLPAAH